MYASMHPFNQPNIYSYIHTHIIQIYMDDTRSSSIRCTDDMINGHITSRQGERGLTFNMASCHGNRDEIDSDICYKMPTFQT